MNKCVDCWNRIMDGFCSRQFDMSLANYKQCVGFKHVPIKVNEILKSSMNIKRLKEEKLRIDDSNFEKFLRNGGHWCFNDGKFNMKVK